MKENKRNTTVLIIITIALFLVAVLGATFAYFATERNVTNAINANVQTASSMYSFSATSNGNIEMNIAFNEMSEANVSTNVLKTDNATIEVNLASPTDDMLTTCTYDIVWVWDSEDMYTAPDVALPYTHTDNKVYNYEFSTKVDNTNEADLSKLPIDNKTVTLQEGASITATSTTPVVKTYDIAAYIYNLPVEQTNLFGKNFKAHITIDNLNCNMEGNEGPKEMVLATYIKNDVYNSEDNKLNIGNGAAGLYYHDSSLANGANDNTYRYAGEDANVNNYVCFKEEGVDCTNPDDPKRELYRIISVDSTTNQTKVIKVTKLANPPAWNDTSTNTWAGGSLETYLNGEYLNELKNKTDKIVATDWHVGGLSTVAKTPQAIYEDEKADTTIYKKEIGLMYPSEYGFAALPELWGTNLNSYNPTKDKDWMFSNDFPWTISRYSTGSDSAFFVYSGDGAVYGSRDVADDRGVRPSFNLSSDVKITNAGEGVGTSSNPMIIS